MQIGLFGGTFNPVHLGHLKVAQEVKQRFDLDLIQIIPSAIPPHKKKEGMADAADRLEMARFAFKEEDDFIISDVELRRKGPSYTIDTVRHFKSFVPANTVLYLIMGVDAFLEIDTWMSFKDLFKSLSFIIISRPGRDSTANVTKHEVENVINMHVCNKYEFSKSRQCYHHKTYFPIYFLNINPIDISSTVIRECVKNHISIDQMVPLVVKNYIKNKGLYL